MAEFANTHQQSYNPRQLPIDIVAGLFSGIVALVASVSFAALIFSGDLSNFVGQGIYMALISAAISGALLSFVSGCPVSVFIPQDRIAPILAVMAGGLAVSIPLSSSPETLLVTVLACIVLTTLLTGLFLITLGYFSVGGMIRFLPFPVIGGFLAGTGWLLLVGAMRVLVSEPLATIDELQHLFDWQTLLKWLPGIALALLLCLVGRLRLKALLIPLTIVLSTAAFYGALYYQGLSFNDPQVKTWILGVSVSSNNSFNHILDINWQAVHWPSLLGNAGNIGTVLLLSGISVMMTVSALELISQKDTNTNRELQATGATNLLIGVSGGMVSFHSLSLSGLAWKLGGRSAVVGISAAAIPIMAIVFGGDLLAYLPKPLLGGVLAYLGFSFLKEWLWNSRNKLSLAEYSIIPLILVTIIIWGFLAGIFVGLITAIVLFVISYSRIDIVRFAYSCADRRSSAERNPKDTQLLQDHGDKIHIISLQGYLFFGTTQRLIDCIQHRLIEAPDSGIRYVILDFKHVNGIDSSAAKSFAKILQLAEQNDFCVVITKLSRTIKARLYSNDFLTRNNTLAKFFSDLDHGLEWCENQLLQSSSFATNDSNLSILDSLLKQLPDKNTRAVFLSYLQKFSFSKDTLLVKQGDDSDCLYFVEEGQVSVYLETQNQQSIRLRKTDAGTVIGELGFYLEGKRSASVVTNKQTLVYRLDAQSLSRMETEAPEVAMAFHRFVARFSAQRLVYVTHALEAISA